MSDKHPLSLGPRETSDVAAAAARLVRAVGRRVAAEDAVDLRYLLVLDAALAAAWRDAVDGLRFGGVSDAEIGAELVPLRDASADSCGLTKQAVAQRWPRR